ncbi:MAG TPA: cobalt transporter CbiM [Jatrophihabitans sp.]|uniref:cobalt transporter CbiM n=1 Tax=Jatrophihabitans sp. TaxID=1932789 RepID=UPI002EE9F459
MHIPDGYLSPSTCAVTFAVAVPMLAVAARRVRNRVKNRQVPTLAMLSAMSFLVMMFNIPVPDGTSAHAAGGVLVAILLGPWAGLIAVSVALAFQALLFGDGGVLVYGANVLNLGIVLPFVGYGVYRLVAGGSTLTSRRRVIAAAAGGYVGLTASSLACGVLLGIQPSLFTNSDGVPLYSPYDLSETIPAMLLAHLLVAGVAEAVLTAGVISYLQRANIALLSVNHPKTPIDEAARVRRTSRFKPIHVALTAIVVMVLLTPLGLLAPGGAFGEEAPQDLKLTELNLSTVPTGLQKYNGFWEHTPIPGYDFTDDKHPVIGYLISAAIGVAVIAVLLFLIAHLIQWISRSRRPEVGPGAEPPSPHKPTVDAPS